MPWSMPRLFPSQGIEFETHLRTAHADMVAALTKSAEVSAHNSALIEQI